MVVSENDKKIPLVSIITACYNEELYISELLESILNQTYKNIEMFCIDDGSTDMTASIIKSFIDRFADKGFRLNYIYQENCGQASATNKGLKLIRGKYLCWIDGDDYLVNNSIEKRVSFLEKHPELSIVTSDFYLNDKAGSYLEEKALRYGNLNYQKNQFHLTLIGESIIENLAQMLRVEDFKKINPRMEISECREGQNYQMLLPMLYYYQRGFINEKLAYYRIHADSHSNRKRGFDEQVIRYDSLIEMTKEILTDLGLPHHDIVSYLKNSTFYIEKGRYLENVGIK